MALVGLIHATSHFFHLLLPPLFPVFGRTFGLSWTELGLLVTAFYAVSGVGQALSGFVVDRVGAWPVLVAAMVAFLLASVAAGTAQGYGGLMLAALLAGAGNAPFHPANFTVLNQRVSPARVGHAFAVHGLSGNLGWALTPVFVLLFSLHDGEWRWVYAGTAAVALAMLLLLIGQRRWLRTTPAAPSAAGSGGHFGFLRLPAIWLCFSFFLFTTAALTAIQGFAAPALGALHGRSPESFASLVTFYMLAGAAGMVVGGFWAARQRRVERNIARALVGSAACLVLATVPGMPATAALTLVALAGVGTGLAGPNRDLLVRQAAPPGATGRVYGTVYSGLDIGFAVTAPLFGLLLDGHWPRGVLVGSALCLLLALLAAQAVAWVGRRRSAISLP